MRKFKIIPLLLLLLTMATSAAAQKKTQKTYIPWDNGKLVVSEEGRYLKHENGAPFFWLGETGWLLPERLNRDEAEYYLEQCKRRGYNVIQVQTLNNVPSMNIYGQYSMIDGYNFKNINQKGVYGYWDHMDYIIRTAAKKGQYIGMVCIWGSPVNRGEMTVEQAKAYGKFLAERYKDEPNIIWFIGGDRLNVFIITFATLIKNKSRNKDYDEVLSAYSHIHVHHDPLGLRDSICVST